MQEETHRIAVRAVVRGKVQGVWFRAWTNERATALGLDGWVRNLSDGSVEALFSGPADKVETMLKCCLDGPSAAVVTDIERFDADPLDEEGFRKRPTR